MVQLALDMLLTGSGDLEPVYIKSLSEVQHLSVIQQHLSSDRNACMTEALEAWAVQAGEPVMRLLRLTSRFEATVGETRIKIGIILLQHDVSLIERSGPVFPTVTEVESVFRV